MEPRQKAGSGAQSKKLERFTRPLSGRVWGTPAVALERVLEARQRKPMGQWVFSRNTEAILQVPEVHTGPLLVVKNLVLPLSAIPHETCLASCDKRTC